MPDEDVACPNCGSTRFYIHGVVAYRQPYDSITHDFGETKLFWDFDYRRWGDCAQCGSDLTEYLVQRKVLDAVHDVVPRRQESGAGGVRHREQ